MAYFRSKSYQQIYCFFKLLKIRFIMTRISVLLIVASMKLCVHLPFKRGLLTTLRPRLQIQAILK
jgi:hypothetical protein